MQASKIVPRVGRAAAGLALVASLASCGGGGGDDNNGPPVAVTPPTPVATTPPASASASSAGLIAYLKGLVATSPETTEPLDLSAFTAPVDDTGGYDTTI